MKKLFLSLLLLCSPMVAQVTLPALGTHQFTAVCTFSNHKVQPCPSNLLWSSSVPSLVNVNAAGLAQAYSAGSANITASVAGITSNIVKTTAMPLMTSVTISASQTNIAVGTKTSLQATCHYVGSISTSCNKPDIYGNSISLWAVAPGTIGIASIDSTGVVTATSAGAVAFAASSGLNSGLITIIVH